jgi:predicted outer membrane repeat protein
LTFENCGDITSGTGGGTVYIQMGNTFNISSCKFRNNSGKKGGALSVAPNINNPDSRLTISNSAFENNIAVTSSGGAIFTTMVNADIVNSTFTNNIGKNFFSIVLIF